MARMKQKKFQVWWIVILAITLAVVVQSNLPKQLSLPQRNTKTSNSLTKEEVITKVKALPEVTDYLKRVPSGLVEVNGEEDNVYLVQVYEFKDGHTATFNWYKVDKTTGEVKKEF